MNTQFIVDEAGKKTSVILPVEDYEELLEDIHDLTVIAERKNEPSISFDDLKKKVKSWWAYLRLIQKAQWSMILKE